jgi:hypothetical protein
MCVASQERRSVILLLYRVALRSHKSDKKATILASGFSILTPPSHSPTIAMLSTCSSTALVGNNPDASLAAFARPPCFSVNRPVKLTLAPVCSAAFIASPLLSSRLFGITACIDSGLLPSLKFRKATCFWRRMLLIHALSWTGSLETGPDFGIRDR